MSTKDWELLDQNPNELEKVIRQYPNIVKSLDGDVVWAMLGWGQANQDHSVAHPCWEEYHRRAAEGYKTPNERLNEALAAEEALKDRVATDLEFEGIVENCDLVPAASERVTHRLTIYSDSAIEVRNDFLPRHAVGVNTTTDTINYVAQIIGNAQQGLAGGTKRKTVIAELQNAHEILQGMVSLAVGAQAERARREAEIGKPF